LKIYHTSTLPHIPFHKSSVVLFHSFSQQPWDLFASQKKLGRFSPQNPLGLVGFPHLLQQGGGSFGLVSGGSPDAKMPGAKTTFLKKTANDFGINFGRKIKIKNPAV